MLAMVNRLLTKFIKVNILLAESTDSKTGATHENEHTDSLELLGLAAWRRWRRRWRRSLILR